MGAAFHYLSPFEIKNQVGPIGMAQIVGDQEGCISPVQSLQRFQDGMFVFLVQTGHGFIQNQNRRVPNGRTRNRQPLPLALRKGHAPLAKHRFVTLRQGHDKVVGIREPGSGFNFFQRRRRGSMRACVSPSKSLQFQKQNANRQS